MQWWYWTRCCLWTSMQPTCGIHIEWFQIPSTKLRRQERWIKAMNFIRIQKCVFGWLFYSWFVNNELNKIRKNICRSVDWIIFTFISSHYTWCRHAYCIPIHIKWPSWNLQMWNSTYKLSSAYSVLLYAVCLCMCVAAALPDTIEW